MQFILQCRQPTMPCAVIFHGGWKSRWQVAVIPVRTRFRTRFGHASHTFCTRFRTRSVRRKNVTVQKAPKCGALAQSTVPEYRHFLQSFTGTTGICQDVCERVRLQLTLSLKSGKVSRVRISVLHIALQERLWNSVMRSITESVRAPCRKNTLSIRSNHNV